LSGWFGRRKFVLLATPFVICGWLITGFAQNKIMLFVGRLISGGKWYIFFSCF
jgi:predicted MFS family arabinose efflux permease